MTTRHNITVTALNGKYYLDGVEAPILDLISGHTYIFDLSDASLSTHPFRLKLNNTEWGDNVVLTNSTLTLEVPSTSLGSLSYFCTNHAGMGNHFNIIPNQINGDDQNNILTGLFGDDIITGGLGEDIIFGKDGDDTIITDSHGNYMYGGAGNDTILISEKTQSGVGFPKILLGEGNDFIDVKDELTWLKLNFEKWWLSTPELTFWSETDSPIIEGILINGLDIPFEIAGQTLQPNTVKDAFGKIDQISKLRGFSAFGTQFDDIAVTDDWLFWETSLGNDTILMPFGKNGIFKIENYWIDAAVNWDLSQKYFIFTDSDGKQHTLSVDNLVNDIDLGNNNDTLHGNALDNVIRGRGGNDNLDGADGDDTLDGGDGDDIIRGGDGDDIIYTGGANDRDRIYGDEGDDTIIKTGNGSLSVYGGAGNDIIDLQGLGIGSYANVRPNIGANTIIGPETKWNANDDGAELYYDDVEGSGGIVATFSSPGTGTVTSRNAGFINDNFTFVSRIRGTSDDDHFIGSDNERWEGWEGFAGNDLIEAGGGFDELLYHQSYQGGGSGAATVNFATGTALDPFGDTDNFSGIEAVRGTAKNDVFIGSSTQEYIRYRGLDGADTFIGTSSWDQANYERDEKYGGTSGIIADLAAGTIQDGFGAIDTVSLIDEVKGTEFDDIISSKGVSFHQRLWGNGGDDTITGGDSDDIIKGGDGDDIIRSGDGDDILYTGSGDDRVFGEAGDDTIIQDGSGTQFYDGGLGSDTIEVDTYGWVTLNNSYPQIVDINLSTGNMGQKDNPNRRDTFTSIENITFKGNFDAELTGDSNANIIRGGDGNDIIRGGDGDDVLYTGSGDDFLYGEEGNDTLISNGGGSQTLDGGSGQDWFRQDLTNYNPTNLNINYPQIVEIDLARGLAGQKDNPNRQETLISIENIDYRGTIASELTGNSEANTILGGNGNDIIRGGNGDDTLSAWMGDDEVYAGAGDDIIINTGGEDLFDGGEGIDTLITDLSQSVKDRLGFSNWDFDIVFDLTAEDPHMRHYGVRPDGTDYAWDEIYSIENYTLIGDFDAQLIGDDQDNILIADSGNDIIRGGAGNDTLIGGAGNDQLFGEAGDDTIIQNGSGTQHYDGGDGNDTIKLDIEFLGALFDERITVDLKNGFSGLTDYPDHELNDTIINIENIDLNNVTFDLELVGDDHDNIIIAGSGKDRINGLAGNDIIDGGAGEDTLFYHLANSSISIDSTLGIATDGLSGTDTFSNIEVFIGSEHNDTLLGRDTFENVAIELNAVNGDTRNYEQFFGGAGDDQIDGRGGYDEINYITSQIGLTIDLNSSSLSDGLGGIDSILNIEGVEATNYDDYIYGTDGSNSLDGRFGNNIIDGRAGYDFVEYNDNSRHNLNVNLTTGRANFTEGPDGTSYVDTLVSIEGVIGSSNNDIIIGDANGNKLYGKAGDDIIRGGDGDDTLYTGDGDDFVYGEAGNDTLVADGSGSQTLDGGSGSDWFRLDLTNYDPSKLSDNYPTVVEVDLDRGISGQKDNPNRQETLISIENIDYRGTIASELTGNSEANTILGGDGDDHIRGQEGNDTIFGGDGSDDIRGNGGSDILSGGSGKDVFYSDIYNWNGDEILDFEDGESIVFQYSPTNGKVVKESDIEITSQSSIGGIYAISIFKGESEFTVASTEQLNFHITVDEENGETTLLGQKSTIDPGHLLSGSANHWKDSNIGFDGMVSISLLSVVGNEHVMDANMTSGSFEITDIPPGAYHLDAFVDATDVNRKAITASDALAALKISVGVTQDASAHQLIAADVNQNGKVNSADALAILKMAVGHEDALDKQFVFVDAKADMSHMTTKDTAYDTGIVIENMTTDVTDIELTGILLGDINGNYVDFV